MTDVCSSLHLAPVASISVIALPLSDTNSDMGGASGIDMNDSSGADMGGISSIDMYDSLGIDMDGVLGMNHILSPLDKQRAVVASRLRPINIDAFIVSTVTVALIDVVWFSLSSFEML